MAGARNGNLRQFILHFKSRHSSKKEPAKILADFEVPRRGLPFWNHMLPTSTDDIAPWISTQLTAGAMRFAIVERAATGERGIGGLAVAESDTVNEIAATILQRVTTDADPTIPTSTYVVYALPAEGDAPIARVFVQVPSPMLAAQAMSAPHMGAMHRAVPVQSYTPIEQTAPAATLGNVMGHLIRSNEMTMRVALGHTDTLIQRLQDHIETLSKRIRQLEEERNELLAVAENVRDRKHEREIEKFKAVQQEQRNDRMKERAVGSILQYLPLAMRVMAVKAGIAPAAEPNPSAPPSEADGQLLRFLSALPLEQQEALFNLFTPEQKAEFSRAIDATMKKVEAEQTATQDAPPNGDAEAANGNQPVAQDAPPSGSADDVKTPAPEKAPTSSTASSNESSEPAQADDTK